MALYRNDLPIGVFDSGIGGLTVLKKLIELLPSERFKYLGDTARVPYGNRSPETIMRYAREACGFLVEKGVKLIVIACNTVSAVAAPMLRVDFDIPVIGVIESTSLAATKSSRNGRIGVIGTRRTIQSEAYNRAIALADSRCEVMSNPAPLLVPLAEEGIVEGELVDALLDRYLTPILKMGIDTLILGCTHYELFLPALKHFIRERLGRDLVIVDSSTCVAHSTREFLEERELAASGHTSTPPEIFVTDDPVLFSELGSFFFGGNLTTTVRQITL